MKFFAAVILALTGLVSAMPAEKRAGNCTSPAVHVEWRSLTQDQRNSFHNAVKCLRTKTSSGVTLFDRYPSVHSDLFGQVHYVAQFLPWHRWFLYLRRLDLQDCGYTGPTPYWDWTIDSPKLSSSDIWDPTTGFGGNGNKGSSSHCVENGPYANFQLTYPNRHCLARRFNNGNVRSGVLGTMQASQYSSSMIRRVLGNDNYIDFSNDLEEIPHDAIHNVISGDMAAAFSPNDALFFLHHQNIDRLWAKWQGRGSRLREYAGNTVQGQDPTDDWRFPLAKLSDKMIMKRIRDLPDIRVADVMDTMSDNLCYVYDK
ncbi:tyrosinase [Ceratobasidium sp. AG-Ba]|nr:tyrosinase [Ceratobasidium sp. AG-Ba]QRW08932.1 tyrosinase [Ceratobasidium sp. AG-Ba]